jgi:hypothetical protein
MFMPETFAALFAAHLAGDFIFQTDWMVRKKAQSWGVLLFHAAIVTLLSAAFMGSYHWPILLVVFVTHAGIDIVKVAHGSDTFTAFSIDQAAHLIVLALLAGFFPEGAAEGWWMKELPRHLVPWYFAGLSLISGVILTVKVGGVIIGKATRRFLEEIWDEQTRGSQNEKQLHGLKNGGRYIGYLERSLVLLLVLINHPTGIGFLIAAKSILRFGEIKDAMQRKTAEYIIIGTFMSFGWALLVAVLTRAAIEVWIR